MQQEDYNARTYLERGIITTVDTVSVGILSILEKHFGHLWGQDKHKDELDSKEEAYLVRWKEARSEILGRAEKSKEILLNNTEKRLTILKKERERFDD